MSFLCTSILIFSFLWDVPRPTHWYIASKYVNKVSRRSLLITDKYSRNKMCKSVSLCWLVRQILTEEITQKYTLFKRSSIYYCKVLDPKLIGGLHKSMKNKVRNLFESKHRWKKKIYRPQDAFIDIAIKL